MTGPNRPGEEALDGVLGYHERTKHHLNRQALSLGYLDWATQPDPFRAYDGAPRIPLDEIPPGDLPRYDDLFCPARIPPRPLDRAAISQLLHDSLALSAWKEAGESRWSLRVNPSSGDLHPTEGYLLAGPIPGLLERPALCHYSPFLHALERRAEVDPAVWAALIAGLPAGTILVGMTSIWWRESWKYGERAFRYCQHDAGHALAAVSLAGAALGLETRLLEAPSHEELEALLGAGGQSGMEAEHPEMLIALFPPGVGLPDPGWRPPAGIVETFRRLTLAGVPNRLSEDHHEWPVIEAVDLASRGAGGASSGAWDPPPPDAPERVTRPASARKVIQRRRSAVAMDGETSISRDAFYGILERTLPRAGRPPFAALPWRPAVHLALFVHRVGGLDRGLYILPRSDEGREGLRGALRPEFLWDAAPGCPPGLDLRLLLPGDLAGAAGAISCHQEIASDGAFALGMVAAFEGRIREEGAPFYRRIHWEAGAVGQVLYLEAEAAGVRGTGIGCFFDDAMHDLLGLGDRRFQTIYHFTVGGPVEDRRLRTLDPYFHLR